MTTQLELVRARYTEIVVFSGRSVRQFLRSPSAVVSATIFPIVMLGMQVVTFGRLVGDAVPGDYVDRVAPLVVLTTCTFVMETAAFGLYYDARTGLLDRLRTMAVSVTSLLAGRVFGDIARIVVVAALATAAAHAIGFRFAEGPLAAIAFFAVLAAFGFMVTWISLMVGLLVSSRVAISGLLGLPTLLLYFLSSGFVPVGAFPEALQPFVRINPMSTTTETMIGLSSGGPVAGPLLHTLAWVTGVSLLCAVLASRKFRALTH
jgi:ABC-2 type transport system permease protein